MPFILGEKKESPHTALYWRSDFNKAIRKGDWKFIVNEYDNSFQLYDLKNDKEEKHNLYQSKKEIAEGLLKELNTWETSMIQPLWPRVVNYVYRDDLGKYVFAF
jgi:arylsulfatase A-like enzyme